MPCPACEPRSHRARPTQRRQEQPWAPVPLLRGRPRPAPSVCSLTSSAAILPEGCGGCRPAAQRGSLTPAFAGGRNQGSNPGSGCWAARSALAWAGRCSRAAGVGQGRLFRGVRGAPRGGRGPPLVPGAAGPPSPVRSACGGGLGRERKGEDVFLTCGQVFLFVGISFLPPVPHAAFLCFSSLKTECSRWRAGRVGAVGWSSALEGMVELALCVGCRRPCFSRGGPTFFPLNQTPFEKLMIPIMDLLPRHIKWKNICTDTWLHLKRLRGLQVKNSYFGGNIK